MQHYPTAKVIGVGFFLSAVLLGVFTLSLLMILNQFRSTALPVNQSTVQVRAGQEWVLYGKLAPGASLPANLQEVAVVTLNGLPVNLNFATGEYADSHDSIAVPVASIKTPEGGSLSVRPFLIEEVELYFARSKARSFIILVGTAAISLAVVLCLWIFLLLFILVRYFPWLKDGTRRLQS